MSSEEIDLRAVEIAYHEAGHALMGLVAGFDIEFARGLPNAYVSVSSKSFLSGSSESLPWKMLFMVAGDVAESLGRRDVELKIPGEARLAAYLRADVFPFHTDREREAVFLSLFLHGESIDDLVAEWREYFLDCLNIFRTGIWKAALARVAHRLMEDETLSGKVIASLVDIDLLRTTTMEYVNG